MKVLHLFTRFKSFLKLLINDKLYVEKNENASILMTKLQNIFKRFRNFYRDLSKYFRKTVPSTHIILTIIYLINMIPRTYQFGFGALKNDFLSDFRQLLQNFDQFNYQYFSSLMCKFTKHSTKLERFLHNNLLISCFLVQC